ncbi:MAG: type IX secretion system outer membrane channel protein PorV [Syntrophothermus sp.]
MQKKNFLYLILGFVLSSTNLFSQTENPITTAVPFLQIAPDARGGGMGDVGVSTSPDAFSLYWNPAKLAFSEKDFGVGLSYVPWLRGLVNDIGLTTVSGFKKFGDKQAVGMSIRYFSMGEVNYTDEYGVDAGTAKPNEFSIDATYSRKFSQSISGAVAGRFIYSNLTPGLQSNVTSTKAGISVAADIALYYTKELGISGLAGSYINVGLDISNIGAKISYGSTSNINDFLPTNLRLGPTLTLDIDEFNRFSISVDINKLLVPTPPIYQKDSMGLIVYDPATNKPIIEKGKDDNVSPITGMFQSFYDAPNGFKEEMQEVILAGAAEYWYNKLFAIRAGYFYENKYKGNRQFFTLGAGLRYNVFGLDFSYLIPVQQNNPLQNTMQFTLLFNFDKAEGKK